jgi:hypothetical protein
MAKAGAGMVSFGLGPAIGSMPFVGDAIANGVEKALGGLAARRSKDAEAAATILGTLLRY